MGCHSFGSYGPGPPNLRYSNEIRRPTRCSREARRRAVISGLLDTRTRSSSGCDSKGREAAGCNEDPRCPRPEQDALLAGIRGSRLVIFEGAGHMLHVEEPEPSARQIAAFVTEVTR